MPNLFRLAGKFLECERDQLLRFHARAGEGLEDLRVGAAQGLHGRRDSVSARVRFGFGVRGGKRHKFLVLSFETRAGLEVGAFELMTFLLHRPLRVHLRFANLALLVFDGDFRVQLVLFDRPFLLDRGVAPGVNGLVGLFEELLAGLGFQGNSKSNPRFLSFSYRFASSRNNRAGR